MQAQLGAAADDPVIRALADDGPPVGITASSEPSPVDSGELYPPTVNTAEEQLRFYAARYPITEVDSTFCARLPNARLPFGPREPTRIPVRCQGVPAAHTQPDAAG
jgi:hypothetical protein